MYAARPCTLEVPHHVAVGTRTHAGGTATSGSSFCRRASRSSASGRNTEGDAWSLPFTIGHAAPGLCVSPAFRFMGLATCVCSGERFDREAGGFPFGIAVLKPTDEITPLSQGGDRFERENAIRAAAIGDHFPICRKLA